jgi:hypothetical protein
MLCIFAAAILIPPAFPSQDGPLHLYYTQVTRDLITNGSAWGGYFVLRRGIPPYLLQTVLLIMLEMIIPPLIAEKVLVVLCVMLLCGAFRRMARSLDPDASWSTLLIFPVAMHKPLYMGFYNFSLGLGIALWLCAYWVRRAGEFKPRHAVVFLFGVALLAITHPVALILILLFIALEQTVRAIRAWRAGASRSAWLESQRWTLFALAAGYSSLFYLALYMKSGNSIRIPDSSVMLSHAGSGLEAIWPMRTLLHQVIRGIITAGVLLVLAYRIRFVAAQASAGAIAILLFSGICAALFVIAPNNVNGGDYFNERFALFAFVFLLAFCAGLSRPKRLAIVAGAAAAVLSLMLLTEQSIRTRPFAQEAARLEAIRSMLENQRGVVLATRGIIGPADFNFSPCAHIAAHYFRRAHAILVNAEWLHMPISLLAPRAWAPYQFLDPHRMTEFGLRHPDRLPQVDFIAAESCPPGSTDAGLDQLVRWYGAERSVVTSTACVAIRAANRASNERSIQSGKSVETSPASRASRSGILRLSAPQDRAPGLTDRRKRCGFFAEAIEATPQSRVSPNRSAADRPEQSQAISGVEIETARRWLAQHKYRDPRDWRL